MSEQNGLPLEQFIQALTSQLDRAQNTLALKARAGLPMTFAVKDISFDLRTHVEIVDSVVRIRPAGAGEVEASTIHLALTTITRPMIEENTMSLAAAPDEPSVKQVLGKDISDEEQRRLEWAGIHTVSQLRELQKHGGEQAIERVVDIPVMRLRAALARAAEPILTHITHEPLDETAQSDGSNLLRIRGHNLVDEAAPRVRIDGEQVPVLRATNRELLVAALPHQRAGTLSVEIAPGVTASREFALPVPEPPRPPKPSGGDPA